jgi:hypothetical protein
MECHNVREERNPAGIMPSGTMGERPVKLHALDPAQQAGTISGEAADSCGCLLEITRAGREPVALPDGSTRTFPEDGDEIIMRGRCERDGFVAIGLGTCAGEVLPAQ